MEDISLEDREPKKWAVLIGVNFYIPGTARLPVRATSLNGCVNDIELVEEYLLDRQGFEPSHILKLTASFPPSSSSPGFGPGRTPQLRSATDSHDRPPEPNDRWPTYENMVHAFEDVTTKSHKDDIVYIHYSGHGGRAVTILPELKASNPHRPDRPGIDETLVPTDFNIGGRYLRDVEIAALLKRMVDKGLHVTIVLDSCHSGGAGKNGDPHLRNSAVRAVAIVGVLEDSVDWIRLPTDTSDLSEAELKAAVELGIWRLSDGSKNTWHPQGLVMIAACLPHEVAGESAYEDEKTLGGKIHGHLTYGLIQTLKLAPSDITHDALHRRVREVVGKKASQTPVILGNIRRKLFLSTSAGIVHAIAVAHADHQRVQLRGGRAQGVYKGDRYGIYSWDASRREDFGSPLATVRVTVVRAIDSDAVFEPNSSHSRVVEGSQALLLERALPRTNIRLKLVSSPDAPETENRLFDRLRESDVTTYAGGGTQVTIGDGRDDQPNSRTNTLQYYVTLNEKNQYHMHESEDIKASILPPCDTPESLFALAMRLGRYHGFLTLENPAWPSPNFKFEPLPSKHYSAEKKVVEISDGESLVVRFKNNTSSRLYLTVFDFTSQWGVVRVYPDDADFEEVDWGHHRDIEVGPEFPQQFSAAPYVVETLKAFVTTTPASFRSLEVGELDFGATQSAPSYDIQQIQQLRHNLSTLDSPRSRVREVAGLDVDLDDQGERPMHLRGVQSGTDETWQTKNIAVHIYPPVD